MEREKQARLERLRDEAAELERQMADCRRDPWGYGAQEHWKQCRDAWIDVQVALEDLLSPQEPMEQR